MFLDLDLLFVTIVVGKVPSELANGLIDLDRRSVVQLEGGLTCFSYALPTFRCDPRLEVYFSEEVQCLVAPNVTAYTRHGLCQTTLVERSNLHWKITYGEEATGAGICLVGSVGHQLVDGWEG